MTAPIKSGVIQFEAALGLFVIISCIVTVYLLIKYFINHQQETPWIQIKLFAIISMFLSILIGSILFLILNNSIINSLNIFGSMKYIEDVQTCEIFVRVSVVLSLIFRSVLSTHKLQFVIQCQIIHLHTKHKQKQMVCCRIFIISFKVFLY